jgi:N-methylhydantoinase A
VRQIEEDFAERHERQYGHTMTDPVEITTLRLRATGRVDKPELPPAPERPAGSPGAGPERFGKRMVHAGGGSPAEYGLYRREDLRAGDAIRGPAVIAEHTATTVIHDGDQLTVGRYGELVVELRGEGR